MSGWRQAHVYRLYDADDVLLYVGMAFVVESRVDCHRAAPFGSQIARVEVDTFTNRIRAARAERQQITSLRPRWNSVGRGTRSEWTACDYFEELERLSYGLSGQTLVPRLLAEFCDKYPDTAEATLPAIGYASARAAA